MLTTRRLLAALAGGLFSTTAACSGKVIVPGPISPVPVPTGAQDQWISSLTGTAYGDASVSGSADGLPYGDHKPSSGSDQGVSVSGAVSGDENQKSCGTQATDSQARSDAIFTAQHDAGHRSFGFAMSASTYAKGGFWRGKVLFICRGSNNTLGQSNASVTGRLNLSYNAPTQMVDRLVVRVNGASVADAHVEVTDGNNAKLPLTNLEAGGVTVLLGQPGPYTVTASIGLHSENGGGGNAFASDSRSVAISVQSMRDALSLGFGAPATDALLVPLPIFVPVENISQLLREQIYNDHGRFYPCKHVAACNGDAQDLYLENPEVTVQGGALVVSSHLSGHYCVFLFICPGLTGNLRLFAKPTVDEHNNLRFDQPTLEVQTSNALVKYASPKVGPRIVQAVASARLALQPKLDSIVQDARRRFPIPWGGACLLLNVTDLTLRGIVLSESPPGLTANFGAGIQVGGDTACKRT